MKKLLLLLLLAAQQLFAGNGFDEYQKHIAQDRLLLIFEKNISAQQKDELLRECNSISHFTHLPSPNVTICMVNDFEHAQQWAKSKSEIKWVSFFITDGLHYAGVLNKVFVKIKHQNFEPMLKARLQQLQLSEPKADKYITNLYSIEIASSKLNTIEWCKLLMQEGWCEYASPDYLLNPLVNSNDTHYARQWAIENNGTPLQYNGTPDADMDVDSAWTITEGSPNIKISIVDSGVDTLHNDLKNNMLPGYDAVDDSTDGYPTPAYSNDGHGTCCAGIVAAEKDNNLGIAGVAPKCKIIPVRAFYYVLLQGASDPLPYSTASAFADAIGWSWSTANADILSNSWGLPPSLISFLPGGTQPVEDAIQTAYTQGRQGKGVAMFFSSGNEEDSTGVIWPSSLPQTIAVTATNMCDKRKSPGDCSGESWGANYGKGTDFGAPGVKVISTDIRGSKGFSTGDYYNSFNGTSAACPNAAAVGALLLSINHHFSLEDIRHIMATTAEKVGGYGYDSAYVHGAWCKPLGYGRVNAYQALLYAQNYTSVSSVKEELSVQVFPNPAYEILTLFTTTDKGIVSIYNTVGNLVLQQNIIQNSTVLDIAGLSAGVYLLHYQHEAVSTAKKITILGR